MSNFDFSLLIGLRSPLNRILIKQDGLNVVVRIFPQKESLEGLYEKGALKNLTKFIGKHLY